MSSGSTTSRNRTSLINVQMTQSRASVEIENRIYAIAVIFNPTLRAVLFIFDHRIRACLYLSAARRTDSLHGFVKFIDSDGY